VTTVLDRALTRRRILACARCALRAECRRPVPFAGDTPSPFAVLGEGPGRTEDALGEPFVGPSGNLLQTALRDAGLDLSTLARLNVTCCYPSASHNPTAAQVMACRPNLLAQLRVIDPRVVLVVGAKALSAVAPPLSLSAVRGRRLYWDVAGAGRLVIATWHPAAVLRDRSRSQQFFTDCRIAVTLAGLLAGGGWRDVANTWDYSCVACRLTGGGEGERVDQWGLAWCAEHAHHLPKPGYMETAWWQEALRGPEQQRLGVV